VGRAAGASAATVTAAAAVDPGQARRDVDAILHGARFHPKGPPRPLDSVLNWLDDHLQPVWHALGTVFGPIGRFFTRLWDDTLGALPWPVAVVAVLALVGGLVFLLARALEQRAAPRAARASAGAARVAEQSARDLEARADEAARVGDLDRAVRLRFRAGLLRLEHDAHAIINRPGLTTREVRERLHSPRFDGLADTFEAVAYGDVDAHTGDVDTARRDWPVIVGEARHGD
jgi:hypothetical protein